MQRLGDQSTVLVQIFSGGTTTSSDRRRGRFGWPPEDWDWAAKVMVLTNSVSVFLYLPTLQPICLINSVFSTSNYDAMDHSCYLEQICICISADIEILYKRSAQKICHLTETIVQIRSVISIHNF